ncbi:filamentous hemagglutinin N-terminal domain-containing protein [Hyella patelloides]|nr:filamentous hemagglutinin N-terminal domain-containing protein [Hyella patelloides]
MAQVIPDNSLGNENSIMTPNVTVKEALADLIEGGAIRDNNLFHSFSEFNIDNGSRVYFASPDGIANILTRVTGNNISEIFGTLGVDGAANLFLLNPNGIVFGENASLDVNGSFLATTAESYIFNNGLEFSATQANAAPLLTINLTPGLQMGSNSGSIVVQNQGHRLTGGSLSPLMFNETATGLQVQEGQTLGLVGAEINLNGGIIRVPGGNIQLLSIAEGRVQYDDSDQTWQLDSSEVSRFADIELSNKAFLDTSGAITGNIQLQGKNISLKEASAISIQNLGVQPSGEITLDATDTIALSDSVRNAPDTTTSSGTITGVMVSRLITDTLGMEQGGNIIVSGDNLLISDGGSISALSFSNADTGKIDVNINHSIKIQKFSLLNPVLASNISTAVLGDGNAQELNVLARNINLLEGGAIFSTSLGSGNGGEVNVNVNDSLVLNGLSPLASVGSFIGHAAFSTGNSGNLNLNVARLSLSNGGAISSSTFAEGNAGQMTINASEYIEINNIISNPEIFTGIASRSTVLDSPITSIFDLPNQSNGNSGSITINTPKLTIKNNGIISLNNRGIGNSGNLTINTEQLVLDNQSSLAAFSTSGQGGNINLNIEDSLLLRQASVITAETTGTFANSQSSINGGNISINADLVTLLENSQINADALEGNGGNISIVTQGFLASPDSEVSASSRFGLDGNVDIETLTSDRLIELEKLPIKPIDATQQMTTGCSVSNDFALIGKGGLTENPTQDIRGQALWQDLRRLEFHSKSQINWQPSFIPQQQKSFREANAWEVNQQGNLELIIDEQAVVVTNALAKLQNCFMTNYP